MPIADLTMTVVVTQRPFLARLVRFPFVCRSHYRTIRRFGNGRAISLCAAWILAGQVMNFPRKS